MRFGTNMALCYLRKYFFPPYTTPRMAREQILDHIPSCNKHPSQTKENKYSFIWECRKPVESTGLRNFLSVTKKTAQKTLCTNVQLSSYLWLLISHTSHAIKTLYLTYWYIFFSCSSFDIVRISWSDKSIFSLLLGWNKSQSMPCL